MPDVPPDTALPSDPMSDPWHSLAVLIARSKAGQFDQASTLLDICLSTDDGLLAATCADHIGDAGPLECLDRIAERLRTTEDPETALNLCSALHMGGRLADIPIMLDCYERFDSVSDAEIVPIWISDLIGKDDNEALFDPPHHEDTASLLSAIRGRYDEMCDEFGVGTVFVFRAARFGVETLARYLLHRFQEPFVRSYLRQKFEASTGIDCTGFYRREEFRPLSASALVEDFLESGASADYQDGLRYFFGHRIPD